MEPLKILSKDERGKHIKELRYDLKILETSEDEVALKKLKLYITHITFHPRCMNESRIIY